MICWHYLKITDTSSTNKFLIIKNQTSVMRAIG